MTDEITPYPAETPLQISVQTTEAERIACIQAASTRLREPSARSRSGWIFGMWVVVGVLISKLWSSIEALFSHWFSYAVLALVLVVAGLWASRKTNQRLARSQADQYLLTLHESGLSCGSALGEGLLKWTAFTAIQQREDALVLWLRDYSSLWIPSRCFASTEQREAFVAKVSAATGLAAESVAEPIPQPIVEQASDTRAGLFFLHRLAANLIAGVLFAVFRRSAMRWLQPSMPQFLSLSGLTLGVQFAVQYLEVDGAGEFVSGALLYAIVALALPVLTGWAAARAAGRESRVVAAATALAATALFISLYGVVLRLSLPSFGEMLNPYTWVLWWSPLVWLALAGTVALARSTLMAAEQRVGAVLAMVYLFVIPQLLISGHSQMWMQVYDERDDSAERARWERVGSEEVIYRQPRLLEDRLAKLKPGVAGVPELFLVSLAGHGAQDVFMREARSVDQLFAERFGTRERSVVLINNPATVLEQPMATVNALGRTLKAVGQRMNPEEDVLFLFLTSHGAKDFRFDLSLWPYTMNELNPEVLRGLLDAAGIRHRVIVVSACYSGGFVPRLAGPDTLVMSAARPDRNSHGCSHEADWTFFGRAYFDEALRETRSFTDAFERARTTVAQREADEGLEPSEPQIEIGADIRKRLLPFETVSR